MAEHKDERRQVSPCRTAGWSCVLLVACLTLYAGYADAAGPLRHYQLDAGDASIMLNEFSQQSDLQVLFDFNIMKGLRTRPVSGDLDASTALKTMLKGTNLVFDFVNDHTLAVTPKKPSFLKRFWHRLNTHTKHPSGADDLEQVLISGSLGDGAEPLLGGQELQLGRAEIERSGLATAEDLLRTLPQVFGGGPNLSTMIGREAQTNSNIGVGVNIRGLDAGATLVMIDGKRVAPSGTEGAFEDISNIPLSIVDHVQVLPDSVGSKYGADAVGGVVNFVTRTNFSGAYTQAREGSATDGHMGERQFSQLFGRQGDSNKIFFSFEYYRRDPLLAQDRWQETSDLTPYGGSNFNVMYGSPGTITDGVHYWPLPKSQNGTSLIASNLAQGAPNLYDQDVDRYITPTQQRWSLFAKDSLRLSDSLELLTEGLFNRRTVHFVAGEADPLVLRVPESNPFYVNPTGLAGPVTLLTGTGAFFGPAGSDNRIDTGNFSLAATGSLSHGWTANGTIAYAFEKQRGSAFGGYNPTALNAALADPNPATAFNPFADGANTATRTLAAIAATSGFEFLSELKTVGLNARGATFELPGGATEVGLGAEYRIQALDQHVSSPGQPDDNSGRLTRDIVAAFGEARIPIVGEANESIFARRLELSAGIRREAYSDIGAVTIPKVGLLWSLRDEFSLRASWTKSSKPPDLADTTPTKEYNQVYTLPDPSSPTGLTTTLLRYGTNPELKPESARTWTVGADFAPKPSGGAAFSLTYFNISYSGRINEESLEPDVLSQPTLAWLVVRNVSQQQVTAACNQGTFLGGIPGTCADSSIAAIIDNRLRNIALLKTSGVDLITKYSFGGRFGKFELGLNGTYLFNYSQANTPSDPLTDIVSTQNHPIDLRARGSMTWTHRGFGISTFVNFQNSYRDTRSIPNRGVSPWTTVDLQVSYDTRGDTLNWLGHMQFALNARNLLDVYPPFLNNPVGVGYDQENGELSGRLVSFEIRKRW